MDKKVDPNGKFEICEQWMIKHSQNSLFLLRDPPACLKATSACWMAQCLPFQTWLTYLPVLFRWVKQISALPSTWTEISDNALLSMWVTLCCFSLSYLTIYYFVISLHEAYCMSGIIWISVTCKSRSSMHWEGSMYGWMLWQCGCYVR